MLGCSTREIQCHSENPGRIPEFPRLHSFWVSLRQSPYNPGHPVAELQWILPIFGHSDYADRAYALVSEWSMLDVAGSSWAVPIRPLDGSLSSVVHGKLASRALKQDSVNRSLYGTGSEKRCRPADLSGGRH